jgi:hypothetical protein
MQKVRTRLARFAQWLLDRVTDPEPEKSELHSSTRAILSEKTMARLHEAWKEAAS